MLKPNAPNVPGLSAMTDTLEFVKNLWSGIGIPGMVMPTLSVDEINKQIADLKAVESWLTVNMNMLRGTIQALEVQSATLSTLRSMGETLSSTVQSAASMHPSAGPASPQAAIGGESPTYEEQAAPKPEPKRKSRNNLKAEFKEGTKPAPEAAAPAAESAADMQNFAAPLANPAMWWNLLQDQFKQAMASAMPGEPAQPEEKPAGKAARKRKSPPKD